MSAPRFLTVVVAALSAAALLVAAPATAAPPQAADPAHCGPGSAPTSGLQGEVTAAERASGRSKRGFTCNVVPVSAYAGHGGGIVAAAYGTCGYTGTVFPGSAVGRNGGVQVIDAATPSRLRTTATLDAPALQAGTWETLKVNARRRLLVGTGVPFLFGAGLMAVYDVSDCAHPRLLNTTAGTPAAPLPITSHEGGFSPDGRTYWTSGMGPGLLSAVDLSDPARPRVIWQGLTGLEAHGFGISADGSTLYLSHNFGGISVYDISQVTARRTDPQVPLLSNLSWDDAGWATQHSVPVAYGERTVLYTPTEGGSGGVKVIDATDPRRPRLINTIKLAVNLPENQDRAVASSSGGGVFAYESHYCSADRPVNPTALACGWTSSGVRVFDIRDPRRVKEIAYYVPPSKPASPLTAWNSPHVMSAVVGVPVLSAPSILDALRRGEFDPAQARSNRTSMVLSDLSTDMCFSPPEWRGNRLYVTCSDNGFQVIELTNDVYRAPADQRTTVGS
ncbi:hypothetical protein nbrc107696_04900 [Gordonia spumicola]|uniref:LVIVD repeat-containing protein n=1 Tax=Gordonia spumicola TaxID=589161 RepID=A0A7I9V4E6_9ACTN|nr:hypothetical protein [Gordonia spumicola]GEE00044.1 hypothetical protein nbrc107696_04900 [Gordonia spumicola]